MKANKFIIAMTASVLATTAPSFADGNAFTPLNFDDTGYNTSTTTSSNIAERPASNTSYSTTSTTSSAPAQAESVANGNIQNAILQLDNAQTDIKNDLSNYNAKFQEVDNHYKLIKTERNNLKKQIKATERRIKDIDRTKEKLKKNMI